MREGAGGEDPLPGPFAPGVRVLAVEGVGQVDVGMPGGEVLVIDGADAAEVSLQGFAEGLGEHGDAVLLPFAVADGDLVHFEVYVFDAQADAVHESQPGAVEEGRP